MLVGPADDAASRRMATKFPTGALATLTFAGSWAELAPGTATLESFVVPRDLDAQYFDGADRVRRTGEHAPSTPTGAAAVAIVPGRRPWPSRSARSPPTRRSTSAAPSGRASVTSTPSTTSSSAKRRLAPFDRTYAAFDGGAIVATLRSFPTELTVPGGRAIAAGALTAVTCHATHRRQGLLTRMITADLASSVERGEPAHVLIASEYPIYGRFGYGPATQSIAWELDATATGFAAPGCRDGRVRRQRHLPQGGAGDLRAGPGEPAGHDRPRRSRLGCARRPAPSPRGQAVAGTPRPGPRRRRGGAGVGELQGRQQLDRSAVAHPRSRSPISARPARRRRPGCGGSSPSSTS